MVRKFYFAPHWNHHQAGLEALVALHELRNLCLLWRFRRYTYGSQPDDGLRGIFQTMPVARQIHMRLQGLLSLDANTCHQQEAQPRRVLDVVISQNKIPTERFTWLVMLLLV